MNPHEEQERMNQIFMKLRFVDKKEVVIYADLTGKLPITSIHVMTVMFFVYYWTSNDILATLIKEAKAETIVECFKQNIIYLSKRGFKPVYNIIDNVATRAIKTYSGK